MGVTIGCSHFLGTKHERMVRDHYFMCGAEILTASIRSNGNISCFSDTAANSREKTLWGRKY